MEELAIKNKMRECMLLKEPCSRTGRVCVATENGVTSTGNFMIFSALWPFHKSLDATINVCSLSEKILDGSLYESWTRGACAFVKA